MGQACFKTSHSSNQSHHDHDHATNHDESPEAHSELKIPLDIPCSPDKIINHQQHIVEHIEHIGDTCFTASSFNASQEDIREFYDFKEEILGTIYFLYFFGKKLFLNERSYIFGCL